MLIHARDALFDFFFDPRCLACGVDDGAGGLCASCRAACARWPRSEAWAGEQKEWSGRWSAFRYADPVRSLLLTAKYAADPAPLPILGELLARALPDRLRHLGSDFVIPMPTTHARWRARGFNPALWLAGPVAARIGIPVLQGALRRVVGGPPQVGLAAEERRLALRGAMRGRRVGGRRLILVDDVDTTGATLDEAERALLTAGARGVLAVTLCRAPPP